MVATVAGESQVADFNGRVERGSDEVYPCFNRLRPAANDLHAEVRFGLVGQEFAFLNELAGDLSETVTVGIAVGEWAKDQSEPYVTMSRSISGPELQTHVHHVAEVQVDEVFVGVKGRSNKCRQHPHNGLHLRIGHERQINEALNGTVT